MIFRVAHQVRRKPIGLQLGHHDYNSWVVESKGTEVTWPCPTVIQAELGSSALCSVDPLGWKLSWPCEREGPGDSGKG